MNCLLCHRREWGSTDAYRRRNSTQPKRTLSEATAKPHWSHTKPTGELQLPQCYSSKLRLYNRPHLFFFINWIFIRIFAPGFRRKVCVPEDARKALLYCPSIRIANFKQEGRATTLSLVVYAIGSRLSISSGVRYVP